MQILQGKYLKSIESDKGRLKGIQIETTEGKQVVSIPKAISAIAQAEIALGSDIRIWAEPSAKKEKQSKAAKAKKLIAIQIIPLSPKAKISEPKPAQKKTKQKSEKLTVQLCQKKNCCRKGGDELWLAFEAAAQKASTSTEMKDFKLEAVGCLGGCKNGPNIRLLPANIKHRSVKPSDIKSLVGNQA